LSIHRRSTWILTLVALAVAVPAKADNLVNIDAQLHGYAESATIPNIGTVVTPISDAPGGALNQLVGLTSGLYKITNAAGEAGASFDAFQYSQATGVQNWTWNFLVTNATAGNKTVLFGNGSDVAFTQAEAAANAAGKEWYFALTATSTLNFMIRDNYLADNAGGVSLRVTRIADLNFPAVPEPASLVMLALGAILPAAALARRRKPADA
jgi:hypothetical protein